MKHPPYHLRINKSVDRLLLVEIMREMGIDSEKSGFYTLAGPFLEDLRLVAHFFPRVRLFSFESNAETLKRQEFHRFSSRIKLFRGSIGDYLNSQYEEGTPDVFWLDYTGLDYRHFDEFQLVLKRAPANSIIRITLRAQPEIDVDGLENYVSDTELSNLKRDMQAKFERDYDRILPNPKPNIISQGSAFAAGVQSMLKRAAAIALETRGSKRRFMPVQSTVYNDHTEMLSVTGVIYEPESEESIKSRLSTITHVDFDWQMPSRIDMPSLSQHERFLLDKYIPIAPQDDAGDKLFEAMGYRIGDTAKSSKKMLSDYVAYQPHYPVFVRAFS